MGITDGSTISCERCGKVDTSLRVTVFPWVVSVVLVSYKRGAVGIYCSNCRGTERWKYMAISALLGWWGFPWGIAWTLQALAQNAGGGQQPADQNAALLAAIGQRFLLDGDRDAARDAWAASLALKRDATVDRALIMLNAEPVASPHAPVVRPGDIVKAITATEIRRDPDLTANANGSLSADVSCVVLARREGWTHVRLNDGRVGWVPTSHVRRVD